MKPKRCKKWEKEKDIRRWFEVGGNIKSMKIYTILIIRF